ncbi:MAG: VIT domain-containing protein [Candidatus Omnitrophota bacterium]
MKKHWIFLFNSIFFVSIFASAGWTQGLIVPPPSSGERWGLSLPIAKYDVRASIQNQAAVTKIEQEFSNPYDRQVEGTYLFALPPGAHISKFAMEVDGEPVEAELLDKDKAISIYESIVRKSMDPGILYYNGRDLIRARVFPIEAKKSKTIRLQYEEILPYDGGVSRYCCALAAQPLCKKPVEFLKIKLDLKAEEPIRNIFSPSHDIKVDREDQFHAKIQFSDENAALDNDFVLVYSVSKNSIGMNLASYKEKAEDGFFLLLAAPSVAEKKEVNPKNIIFVLDKSGSMKSDRKIDQAKEALEFCLRSLNREDRFALVVFSDEIETLTDALTPFDEDRVDDYCSKIKQIEAGGGTNIDGALKKALSLAEKSERPTYILFLTDGLPTAGEKDPAKILSHLEDWNEAKCRFFTFGVGYNVNTFLLDQIAQNNKGLATYVKPNEDIETYVSSMYNKIAEPVLSDLELDFGDIHVSKMYPKELPDIFSGSQLVLLGRYDEGGSEKVTLSGKASGQRRTFSEEFTFTQSNDELDYIPRLWAARRIGYLMDEIRLRGENKELTEEIIHLSQKYGILTEYTSFLVKEAPIAAVPMRLVEREQLRQRASSQTVESLSLGFGMAEGRQAVSNSAMLQDQFKNASSLSSQNRVYSYYEESGKKQAESIQGVRYAANQAFFNRGSAWISTQFDANREMIQVKPYSKAYFQLANVAPAVSQALALGTEVSFVRNGMMIQIDEKGIEELTEDQLTRLR